MNPAAGALTGLRVLDFTQVVAGPYCTRILADLGADVIKVDKPVPAGSKAAPPSGPPPLNVGKRSIAIDTRTGEGRALARALAAKSDIVVENFRPGVMKQLGLGYEEMRDLRPEIIYCSISGFGQTGSRSGERAYGSTAHAMTGLMSILANAAGVAPFNPGITITDIVTGLYAFGAIGAALHQRRQTGCGQHIDVALLDTGLAFLYEPMQQVLEGKQISLDGRRTPIYKGKDGYVVISTGEFENWQRIAMALGHADAVNDATDEMSRRKLIAQWISEADSVHTAGARLTQENAPCGVVLNPEQALAHPYYQEKGMIVEVPDPLQGRLPVINSPLRFSDSAAGPTGPAPLAGQHTSAILREVLEYGDKEIARLMETEAVSEQPVDLS